MSRFHNALLVGDVPERIKIQEQEGQYALAYVAAKAHGLEDEATRTAEVLKDAEAPIPDSSRLWDAGLLIPSTHIRCEENWPLLEVDRGIIHDALQGDFAALEKAEAEEAAREAEAKSREAMNAGGGWED